MLFVARPAFELRTRLTRLALWDLALVIASGVLWFVARAADMSGVSFADALAPRLLAAVLEETLDGRPSGRRLVLAAPPGPGLLALRPPPPRPQTPPRAR